MKDEGRTNIEHGTSNFQPSNLELPKS